MTTVLLIIIGVLGILLGYSLSRPHMHEKLSSFVNEERHLGKERKKGMLMKHLRDRGTITNDDVERLLGVSHSTATKYFDELQEEGHIVERGDGRGVYYEERG